MLIKSETLDILKMLCLKKFKTISRKKTKNKWAW